MRGRGWSWFWRGASTLAVLLLLLSAFTIADGWKSFGRHAQGPERARMEASPEWLEGHFVNLQPLRNSVRVGLLDAFHASPDRSPREPVPLDTAARRVLDRPPATGLRVTWFGHSTILLELDGQRVLIDPVFGPRASPVSWAGPRRWYSPPLALAELPPLDAVLISHDHYDHLDRPTISELKDRSPLFIVPLGVASHLAYWGVPAAHIIEVDWWDKTKVGGLEVVSTPARHASGRTLLDRDATLWTGYALIGAVHRVYYSGDTGLFPALRDIGARLGPFDLTMIEVGQYDRAWPDWHMGPEQAVRAHQLVRGRVLLPVHWGAFTLAFHAWTEPIERALVAGRSAAVTVVAPEPGQSIEPEAPPPFVQWWPNLPCKRASEDPIISTQME